MSTQLNLTHTLFHGHHWRIEIDTLSIAWVTLDRADGSSNILNQSVLEELGELLPVLEKERPVGAIFRSGKKGGFIAGADIKEFNHFASVAQARDRIRSVRPLFCQLEALPFPTVAQISGFCLGGGLELALCCRFRVAEDSPATRLGLPEVKLGIHPGFGGTYRLPQLIGDLKALSLMLTGKTLSARQAKKIGLVDWLVPGRHLNRTALALIQKNPPPHQPPWIDRLPGLSPLRSVVAYFLRKKIEQKAPKVHYPAPHRIIDLWQESRFLSPRDALDQEIDSIAHLFMGNTSHNLIRLFHLGDRMKRLGKGGNNPTQRLHVIGAGVMGGDIAAWCAWKGLTVTLQDTQEEMIAGSLQRARKLFKRKTRDRRRIQAAMDRLIPDMKGYGVAKADVVIEAIFENLSAKQTLLSVLEPQLKHGAILASNTSSICLEEMAQPLQHPERLIGIHFFNPVALMPLIEIVVGKQSSQEAIQIGCSFATAIGRSPLPVKSGPGFLINRILMPYLFEGIQLVTEGVAPKEVDRAAQQFGMPMGPLALVDVVGLDICLSVARILNPNQSQPLPPLLETLVAQGHLGKKSGQGFYTYPGGKKAASRLKANRALPEDGSHRLFGALLNEAVACLSEGVVEDAALLDAGVVFGTGYAPFRGGPLQTIAQSTKELWLERLHQLQTAHGDRFTPHPGWETLNLPVPATFEESDNEHKNIRHHPPVAGQHPTGLIPGAH
ncbi:MAG: enoyl-CoA hydratase/isomerase family protein [Magnetococcales bacterium]|nr:enoyl-CoA hydratase/isomerase family protein [Magnetococcales bacterium]